MAEYIFIYKSANPNGFIRFIAILKLSVVTKNHIFITKINIKPLNIMPFAKRLR